MGEMEYETPKPCPSCGAEWEHIRRGGSEWFEHPRNECFLAYEVVSYPARIMGWNRFVDAIESRATGQKGGE